MHLNPQRTLSSDRVRLLSSQPLDISKDNNPGTTPEQPIQDLDVVCLLYGSLLGDAHGERRCNSTRFSIKQSSKNVEYLM